MLSHMSIRKPSFFLENNIRERNDTLVVWTIASVSLAVGDGNSYIPRIICRIAWIIDYILAIDNTKRRLCMALASAVFSFSSAEALSRCFVFYL